MKSIKIEGIRYRVGQLCYDLGMRTSISDNPRRLEEETICVITRIEIIKYDGGQVTDITVRHVYNSNNLKYDRDRSGGPMDLLPLPRKLASKMRHLIMIQDLIDVST